MRRNNSGSALLTVLWLTASLAAIGLAVANNVRGETERAATNVDDVRSYFVARGAIDRAALHFLWGTEYYKPGQPAMDLDFPGAAVHVAIIPENSKLSLNVARPEELLRLLMALGVPEDRAGAIAGAILDWRTPDPLHQSAFDSFYLAQSPSFLPRHASFQESEELLSVKGITPDLYFGTSLDGSRPGLRDCLSPDASDAGFDGGVEVNTAPVPVLIAAGLAPGDAEAIIKMRTERPFIDFRQLQEATGAVGTAGRRLRIGGQTMFTFKATARLKQPDGKLSDLRRTVTALVKFWYPGNLQRRPAGFEIVRWYERG